MLVWTDFTMIYGCVDDVKKQSEAIYGLHEPLMVLHASIHGLYFKQQGSLGPDDCTRWAGSSFPSAKWEVQRWKKRG